MVQALFVLILAAGATDCQEAAKGIHLEKFGELAKTFADSRGPRSPPPPGNGIVSFEIGDDGRARAINVECQSSEQTGNFLKGLISTGRFQISATAQKDHRHKVGLSVDVSINVDEVNVTTADFPEADREHK